MERLIKLRKQNFSCIYKILSRKTGKCYIGSAKHFGIRRRNHLFQLQNKKHHSIILQNHVNKYGMEDISFEIIEIIDFNKQTVDKEQYYIDLFTPEFNVLKIAGTSFGRKASLETKEKLRVSHLGKKQSLQTKNRRSQSCKNAMLLLTEEQKENRKKAGKLKAKKVMCIESGFIYLSATDAELQTGCDNISQICNGNYGRKSSGGFTFKFV